MTPWLRACSSSLCLFLFSNNVDLKIMTESVENHSECCLACGCVNSCNKLVSTRSVVVNLFCIGTPFETCLKSCTPLPLHYNLVLLKVYIVSDFYAVNVAFLADFCVSLVSMPEYRNLTE